MNAHYTMDLALTKELERLGQKVPSHTPNVSEGMAYIFHQENLLGVFTVAFAKDWCAGDPAYRWERI